MAKKCLLGLTFACSEPNESFPFSGFAANKRRISTSTGGIKTAAIASAASVYSKN